tara:strand:+ start:216 stop:1034 length:819 start_codon:yes stop_codon:yes gene_type:complete
MYNYKSVSYNHSVRLIISIVLSLIAFNTSFNLFGPGTCSFDGNGRYGPIFVQKYLDNSGAVSCNFAAFLIIFVVIAYWIYILRKYKKIKIKHRDNYLDNTLDTGQNKNPEIQNLEDKLEKIKEEEHIDSLKEELNKKRIEKGLISLSEYEQLEKDINSTKKKFIKIEKLIFDLSAQKKKAGNSQTLSIFFSLPLFYLSYINFINRDWYLDLDTFYIFGLILLILLLFAINKILISNKNIKIFILEINKSEKAKDELFIKLNDMKKQLKEQSI